MLDEGIYGLSYSGGERGADGQSALAVLRNGSILGSDRAGALFTGSYQYDAAERTSTVHVRMQIPPGGELVTGFAAGPGGAIVDIVGRFERPDPHATAVVDVGGRPLEVRLSYLGPLPG